uniref:RWD domain-containing protein n=1 Tax=Ciona savignyi TaxID=51511 RepID=H2ZHD9_CIOSA
MSLTMDNSGSNNSYLEDEILVLQSIYDDQLQIKRHSDRVSEVRICLYPATADDLDSQYLKLELVFHIPKKYPVEHLQIEFSTSRGLSDKHMDELKSEMDHMILTEEDTSFFHLIELAKEHLTKNNLPCDPCPVCLQLFQAEEDLLKTPCFHHMHSFCLLQYFDHYRQNYEYFQTIAQPAEQPVKVNQRIPMEVPCPICRELIEIDVNSLMRAKKPLSNEEATVDVKKISQQNSARLQKIYERQVKLGGIIDLEQEKNKHLLSVIQQKSDDLAAKSNVSSNNENQASGKSDKLKNHQTKPKQYNMSRNKHQPHRPESGRNYFHRETTQKYRNHNNPRSKQFNDKRKPKYSENSNFIKSDNQSKSCRIPPQDGRVGQNLNLGRSDIPSVKPTKTLAKSSCSKRLESFEMSKVSEARGTSNCPPGFKPKNKAVQFGRK